MTKPETRISREPDATVDTTGDRKAFDLDDRTAKFGEMVIAFARRIPVDVVSRPLISQLVRAATSIGANYCEADDGESSKDFRYKIGLCRKESRETKYWLRMIAGAVPVVAEDSRKLWQEAKELNLIFGAIRRRCAEDAK